MYVYVHDEIYEWSRDAGTLITRVQELSTLIGVLRTFGDASKYFDNEE